MNRIPPSERIGHKIEQWLRGDWDGEEDLSTMLLRLGAQRLAQEPLE